MNQDWQIQYLQGGQLGELRGGYVAPDAEVLISKLKARRDSLKRIIAAQDANRAELEKIERMLAAAEGPQDVEATT